MSVAVTIDDFRRDWETQVETYEEMINLLEREKQPGVESQGIGKPTRVWVGMLHTWRDELKELLVQYPGSQGNRPNPGT